MSISHQCELLGISRSAYYYKPKTATPIDELEVVQAIFQEMNKRPFYGYRKVTLAVKEHGFSEKQIRLLMKKLGLRAIFPGKNLSKPSKEHEKYPYLLRDKKIWLPNQAWATDITYIKLLGGHVYLIAIIDLFSRKVLSWSLSNTLDARFCISALEEAILLYGVPAIFNTDQGSQFTSDDFIEVLKKYQIQISMDGVGRFRDNIYVERFWRTLKYEEIYLNEYESMEMLKLSLKKYFEFFNTERFHQSLEYATPDEIYYQAFLKNIKIKAA